MGPSLRRALRAAAAIALATILLGGCGAGSGSSTTAPDRPAAAVPGSAPTHGSAVESPSAAEDAPGANASKPSKPGQGAGATPPRAGGGERDRGAAGGQADPPQRGDRAAPDGRQARPLEGLNESVERRFDPATGEGQRSLRELAEEAVAQPGGGAPPSGRSLEEITADLLERD